jgi:hypothetical protein
MIVYCEEGIFNEKLVQANDEEIRTDKRTSVKTWMARDEAGAIVRYVQTPLTHEVPSDSPKKKPEVYPVFRWDPFSQQEQQALARGE